MKRIAVMLLMLLTATESFAGPPLNTDDTGTVDVGKVEVELNGSFTHDRETIAGVSTKNSTADAELKLTTGIGKNLGVSLAIPYTISERVKEDGDLAGTSEGFGDMTVELKYRFAEFSGVSFAVKPSVILPTGRDSNGLSEGRWQFGGTLIATREFAEGKYVLHSNLGYEHHNYRTEEATAETRSNLWSASIAGEAGIGNGLFVVADIGTKTNPDRISNDRPLYALTGVRYEINEFMDANAGVKLGLNKAEDDDSFLYGIVLKF